MKILGGLFVLCVSALLLAQTRTIILPNIERRQTQIFPVGASAPAQDPLLMSLGNPLTQNQAIQRYTVLGAQAVPGLVAHLQDQNQAIRMLALSALQYAWVPGTESAVLPFLKSPNDSEAKSVWYLLKQKADQAKLYEWAEDNLFTLNPDRVAALLQELERENPNPERMLKLLTYPEYWKAALPGLPRYTSSQFSAQTRTIAKQATGEWLALALASLIHQADRDLVVEQQMAVFLKNEDPRVREMAAEYLRWYGREASVAVLENALAVESDLFARASMEEALRMTPLRNGEVYPEAVQPMTPVVNYAKDILVEDAMNQFVRIAALRRAVGYNDLELRQGKAHPWVLLSPTRSFLDSREIGFGFKAGEGNGPFGEMVHLGRDVSWGEDMATVVAIAPGVVKGVLTAKESWGGLIVMEHTAPNGKQFCSLYAHLGPLITVQVGETIAAGTKLGGLGRSYTAENGGYESHLHFSIYNAPYADGRWVTGYMDPEEFLHGDHKWLDPFSLYPQAK